MFLDCGRKPVKDVSAGGWRLGTTGVGEGWKTHAAQGEHANSTQKVPTGTRTGDLLAVRRQC